MAKTPRMTDRTTPLMVEYRIMYKTEQKSRNPKIKINLKRFNAEKKGKDAISKKIIIKITYCDVKTQQKFFKK